MIAYEERDHIALVTIGRPEKRGALNAEGYAARAAAWRQAAATPSVRVVLVTGTGASFCAGSDLGEFVPTVTGDLARARSDMASDGSYAVLRDVEFPKPIVMAVGGPAMGSGFEMMLTADVRFASPEASFGLPEVRRGLFSGGGSSVRLPRQIPYALAMEILLTGRRISAAEALACGFINRVVAHDRLLEEAMATARLIAENSPTAVQATKRAALEGLRGGLADAYAAELRHARLVFAGPDAREGPRAFIEKRPPVWSDATGL
jgi:enoyl-CoA hydratase